jgi:hypothetical protein
MNYFNYTDYIVYICFVVAVRGAAKRALPRRILQVIPKKKSMFLLAVNYDADIHDALASMRILDGTLPRHSEYGAPVNFFAFLLQRALQSSLSNRVLQCLGKCIIDIICIISIKLMFFFEKFFLFHVLDKVVCPFLVKYFDMPIWHPTDSD